MQVPAWLWDSEPMRLALARLDLGAVMAILRAAAGLSQTDFANLLGDGWSQWTVSSIERRTRDTLYDIRTLLCFADTVAMPRQALLPLVFGDPDATLGREAGTDLAGVFDVNRRSFTALTAGLTAGAIVPPIHVPARVDEAYVRYLWASLDRLRHREESYGGGAILEQAIHLFSRARAVLDESAYTEGVGRRLLSVAAEIGNAAGWAAYDQEDHPLARRLYSEAGVLADSSGTPEVTVHLYTNMAQQSTELARGTGRRGLARKALLFTGRAAEAARHEPSPKLHALIALRRSHAHAELGDEDGFRGAIATARRELDRGAHPADPGWGGFVRDSEVIGFEARGYAALARVQGESNGRAPALYRAVLGDNDRSARDLADYRAGLAQALLAEGDRTQAIAEARSLLPGLGKRMISTRVLTRLRPVRDAAEKSADEEFCGRFDAAARALGAT